MRSMTALFDFWDETSRKQEYKQHLGVCGPECPCLGPPILDTPKGRIRNAKRQCQTKQLLKQQAKKRENRARDIDPSEDALWWGVQQQPQFLERVERISQKYGNANAIRGSYSSLGFNPGCKMHGGSADEVRHIFQNTGGHRTSLGFLPSVGRRTL